MLVTDQSPRVSLHQTVPSYHQPHMCICQHPMSLHPEFQDFQNLIFDCGRWEVANHLEQYTRFLYCTI